MNDWFVGAGEDVADWFWTAGDNVIDWSEGAFLDSRDWFVGAGHDFAGWTVDVGEDFGESMDTIFEHMEGFGLTVKAELEGLYHSVGDWS